MTKGKTQNSSSNKLNKKPKNIAATHRHNDSNILTFQKCSAHFYNYSGLKSDFYVRFIANEKMVFATPASML